MQSAARLPYQVSAENKTGDEDSSQIYVSSNKTVLTQSSRTHQTEEIQRSALLTNASSFQFVFESRLVIKDLVLSLRKTL